MNDEDFNHRITELRPRLHRYCGRMVGSTVDGEDVLQETLLKAIRARAADPPVDNIESWIFRIAHNTSIDFLRERQRKAVEPLPDDIEASPLPESEIVTVSFRTFLQLPELQRCAVILKDVLGHSVEEIAIIADCTPAAAKSALQRGRANLRKLAAIPEDTRLPLMSEEERQRLVAYVAWFRAGDFDAIRAMLAEDVKLDLVNRLTLEGRDKVSVYFTRYAEEVRWRFVFGSIEGKPAMLVFDVTGSMQKPSHFVLLEWKQNRVTSIRDFLYAPYAIETVDWARLN